MNRHDRPPTAAIVSWLLSAQVTQVIPNSRVFDTFPPLHSASPLFASAQFNLGQVLDTSIAFALLSIVPTTRARSGTFSIAMNRANSARRTLQCLGQKRCFSTTPSRAALSPYGRCQQPLPAKNIRENSKRPQSTAAQPDTQSRPVPSPAFQPDESRLDDVQPLRPYRQPEMDHSFVGMKGGEIFHEMMLRHGVKHICTFNPLSFPSLDPS